jgi:hypothetical protein
VSAVIWLGLIVMWVVILVPMWLRRHDEAAENRSVDRFSSAMHTLSRREREVAAGSNFMMMPNRPQSLEVHVSGASDVPEQRSRRLPLGLGSPARPAAPGRSATGRAAAKRRGRDAKRRARQQRAAKAPLTAAARRRRTLIGLLAVTIVTLAAAVVLGGLIWALQGVADVALLGFLAHLRQRAQRSATLPSTTRRPAPVGRPATAAAAPAVRPVPAYADRSVQHDQRYGDPTYEDPIYEDLVIPRRRAVGESLFDQAVPDRVVLPPAGRSRDDSPYDETIYEHARPLRATASASQVFDREAPARPDVAAELAPPVEPIEPIPAERLEAYARDLDLELPTPKPLRKPDRSAQSDDDIGARPWEPVPVPPPTYTTKPVAPPRRVRGPLGSPLLPPTETAAELNPIDNLEEILDRRWAVND